MKTPQQKQMHKMTDAELAAATIIMRGASVFINVTRKTRTGERYLGTDQDEIRRYFHSIMVAHVIKVGDFGRAIDAAREIEDGE